MADTLLLLSGRASTTPPAPADQAANPLSLDRTGRLRVVGLPDVASSIELVRVTTASTNLVLVRSGLTNLLELSISNITAGTIYVKLYNKATAPTAADVPRVIIPVTAAAYVSSQYGSLGKTFPLGLGLAVTGAAAVADATNVAAGALIHGTYN